MNTMIIGGMSCNHCREAVLKAVSGIEGIGDTQLNLSDGKFEWAGDAGLKDAIRAAVIALGFEVK